ncbi:hypothetical protein D931_02532 [Enterococcus faecium 13.SD.W.09]|nr:hypothetical protein D931_02532 [Enterococcus faecium 13.SD.W.09]
MKPCSDGQCVSCCCPLRTCAARIATACQFDQIKKLFPKCIRETVFY